METLIRRIDTGIPGERAMLDDFLLRRKISLDAGATYTAGLFDENDALLATGSVLGNTIRSLAVREDLTGHGLLGTLVTHLTEYLFERGITHVFIYTKCGYARLFEDLGFYEVARAEPFAVLLENKRTGFSDFLQALSQESGGAQKSAAIVMNANPMTLGHLALIEKAAQENQRVHVFVVSEERSFFPAQARLDIVKQSVLKLKNVLVHQTGDYLVSSATFPTYFISGAEDAVRAHALLDAAVFCKIAAGLGIEKRYVGTEPFSHTTLIYNEVLAKTLPPSGIELILVPRFSDENGLPYSASRVRAVLKEQGPEAAGALVPPETIRYFYSAEGRKTIETLRAAKDVAHH